MKTDKKVPAGFKDRSELAIHTIHATDELAFQLLLRNEAFQDIPVKTLKKAAHRIAGMIRNYTFNLERSEGEIKPITDSNANDPDFWFQSAIQQLEGKKKKL